jgi:hypothetical protein
VDDLYWGGVLPSWSADGHELFYEENQIFGVRVNVNVTADSPGFSSRPQVVVDSARQLLGYAVHRDGRFLLFEVTRPARPMPHVVFNWLAKPAR